MRVFPQSLMQPTGFGEVDYGYRTDTYLVQQMHALATALYQAKQRNDKAAVIALRDRFELLANEYRSHGTNDLTAVDNFLLAVDKWVETAVDAIPAAIAALPTAIGSGLIKSAIPFAILFGGYVLLRNWGRK